MSRSIGKPQIPRLNWEATHCTWLWRPLAATLCLVRHLGCQMSNNFQSVYYTTSLFPNSNQGNGMKKGTNLESSSREMHYGNLVFSPIELHRHATILPFDYKNIQMMLWSFLTTQMQKQGKENVNAKRESSLISTGNNELFDDIWLLATVAAAQRVA